jgi:hypothetical protein
MTHNGSDLDNKSLSAKSIHLTVNSTVEVGKDVLADPGGIVVDDGAEGGGTLKPPGVFMLLLFLIKIADDKISF